VRCKSCNVELSGRATNEHTGEPEDLCPVCLGDAYAAAYHDNYEEVVPDNYIWPAKKVDPYE
jgi:hypothetical protein